jgi:nucleotide-binding universal stress UspA family protein
MYEKIVVPLDGSELAESALDYVTGLAAASRAQVTLLHVCTPEQAELGPSRFWDYLLEHAAQVLRSRLEDGASEGSTVDSTVLFGHPAEEILTYAEKNKVSLIAMTTHGRSGVRRWALGSVAARVARHSAVPVLLVRSDVPQESIGRKWPGKRILGLLDGSERAEQVLPYVTDHSKIGGAEVVLLRVLEPLSSPAFYGPDMPGNWEDLAEQMMAHLQEECVRYFAGLKRRLRDAGVQVRLETLEGNIWDEIISYIEKDGFDLVALTTHGRSSIARWAVGSVAETLIRKCPVPLLLVRAR